ncbi:DUF2336 domain-containing protein [Stappia indica]|uniref:DUF2336 domain-containing protein n=1 Tax=Stappia indica TaxID=538381 RepID=UPI00082A5AE6|nr:DUF2336 domain-containing protein [Stappia indica]
MLNELLKLARNPTREARCRLLQRVADLFLDRVGEHSDEELRLFCEIIMKLLDGAELKERARLSQRMAPWSQTPHQIAYRLATDEIVVATPMLELSPALTEADLVKIARRMPESHLLAVARREALPGRVSDALVERGPTKVWRAVAENRRSGLSDWALRTLAKRSLSDTPLRSSMAARGDLTPLICEWLIPHVNASTRVRLEAILSGADPGDLTTPEADSDELRRRYNLFMESCDVDEAWRLVQEGKYGFGSILLVLLAEGRTGDAFELLARQTGESVAAVQRAVFQAGIDELIGLCRVSGTSDQVFLALAHLRCKHLGIPETQAMRWLDAYRRTRAASPGGGGGKSQPRSHRPNGAPLS